MIRHFRVLLVGFVIVGLVTSCDYARMKEQESLNTYETAMPEMVPGAMPMDGGLAALRAAKPDELSNPLPISKEMEARGKERYGFYCAMCHGPNADGRGTVGQSFHPLPADLRSLQVQAQSDGALFLTITFGSKRTPPLAQTVAEADRWAIIQFIRSLTKKPEA